MSWYLGLPTLITAVLALLGAVRAMVTQRRDTKDRAPLITVEVMERTVGVLERRVGVLDDLVGELEKELAAERRESERGRREHAVCQRNLGTLRAVLLNNGMSVPPLE